MNDLNTYQNLSGKVLKSASIKKATLPASNSSAETQVRLQELLDLDNLDLLIKALLKNMNASNGQDLSLEVFYKKFTEILLHLVAETRFSKNISIGSDEFLEILRVALEEQMGSLGI